MRKRSNSILFVGLVVLSGVLAACRGTAPTASSAMLPNQTSASSDRAATGSPLPVIPFKTGPVLGVANGQPIYALFGAPTSNGHPQISFYGAPDKGRYPGRLAQLDSNGLGAVQRLYFDRFGRPFEVTDSATDTTVLTSYPNVFVTLYTVCVHGRLVESINERVGLLHGTTVTPLHGVCPKKVLESPATVRSKVDDGAPTGSVFNLDACGASTVYANLSAIADKFGGKNSYYKNLALLMQTWCREDKQTDPPEVPPSCNSSASVIVRSPALTCLFSPPPIPLVTPTPTPKPTPTPTSSPSAPPTSSPSPSPSPVPTPTPTPSPKQTPTPTPTPGPKQTPTSTPTP